MLILGAEHFATLTQLRFCGREGKQEHLLDRHRAVLEIVQLWLLLPLLCAGGVVLRRVCHRAVQMLCLHSQQSGGDTEAGTLARQEVNGYGLSLSDMCLGLWSVNLSGQILFLKENSTYWAQNRVNTSNCGGDGNDNDCHY